MSVPHTIPHTDHRNEVKMTSERIDDGKKDIEQLKKELVLEWDKLTTLALSPDFPVDDMILGKMFRKHCEKMAELERLIEVED